MSQKAMGTVFDLEGAFNKFVLSMLPGINELELLQRVDDLLARDGGIGAHGRKDQVSHAFIDAELKQLAALMRVMPHELGIDSAGVGVRRNSEGALERSEFAFGKEVIFSRFLALETLFPGDDDHAVLHRDVDVLGFHARQLHRDLVRGVAYGSIRSRREPIDNSLARLLDRFIKRRHPACTLRSLDHGFHPHDDAHERYNFAD